MKAVIFDLDGTLLNTINTIEYYCNNALQKYGFNPVPVDKYKLMVGNGARLLVERAMSYTRGWTAEEFYKVFKAYNDAYDADTLYLTEPYAGVVEMLKSLKDAGYKIAVLSNKPNFATVDVVNTIFGEGLFDLVRGAIDGVPLKPDPAGVFDIMAELGITADEAIFVGDTKVDIATGKNAGLYAVGVLWGFRDEAELTAAGADVIINDAAKILEIVKGR